MKHLLAPLLAAVGSTVGMAFHSIRRTQQMRKLSWDELVAQLRSVNTRGIERLAMDHLQPAKGQLRIEPEDMWSLVGGLEGLARMRQNARIICALAAFAERWNYDESVIVTERIRREAAEVRQAVFQITLRLHGNRLLKARVPFHIHEAASSYHLMRARLLALYETSHAGLYPRLLHAL